MTKPPLNRRDFLKLEAAAMAAAAGGMTTSMSTSAGAANLDAERPKSLLKWDKAACRFCGTGCSVMVGTKDGQVVAATATSRRRSIAASTASRATSCRRSCTGATG